MKTFALLAILVSAISAQAGSRKAGYLGVILTGSKAELKRFYAPPKPPIWLADLTCLSDGSVCFDKAASRSGNDSGYLTLIFKNERTAVLQRSFHPPKPPMDIATMTCRTSASDVVCTEN